jgi:hypothetical protein
MKISFLLGAGFSRPAGYPLASEVSDIVLRTQASGIAIDSSGTAWLRPEFLAHLQSSPGSPFTAPTDGASWSNRSGADALEAVLATYEQQHPHTQKNYEDFFDELYLYYKRDESKLEDPLFQAEYQRRNLHNDPNRQSNERHIIQGLSTAWRIFPQLLTQLIQQNPSVVSPGAGEAYSHFFELIRTHSRRPRGLYFGLVPPAHTFYVHTLNHDLFVEKRFDDEEFHEAIDYDDGFDEMGSPYYGRLYFGWDFSPLYRQGPPYANVRMPRFTGTYSGAVQLVKLHGSLDYYSFGVEGHDTGIYEPLVVKKQPWIDPLKLYREVEKEGKLSYRNDFTNYHPLFLSGTTAKIAQYKDPVLFSHLLKRFEENLADSDVLVVIGYGFRDAGINEYLLPFLEDATKKVIVIGQSLPTHYPPVKPEMFRSGGLEGFDFAELDRLLGAAED